MLSDTRELRSRSIVKALTWRAIATSTTMALAYAATGDLTIVAYVGAADVVLKLFFYYVHERAWGHIAWGKIVPRRRRAR
jgi:adenylylsulfate kinase